MSPLKGPSKLVSLSFLLLIASTTALTTSYRASDPLSIHPRDGATCGGIKDFQQCGSEFPSEFCCPSTSVCQRINSTQTASVICCPKGQDCSHIQPLTCDISQFDATKHPDNQIHIENPSNLKLPSCGNQCCPLGYTCNSGMCSADQGKPSSTSSASTPSATSPSPASQNTSEVPTPVPQSEFPAKAVVAGFFPGMILGALLMYLFLWIIKKRRESEYKNRYSGDFGHVARTVSDPIYDPVYAARTDFLRRRSDSLRGSPNSTTGMVQKGTPRVDGGSVLGTPRIKALFSKSPKIGGTTPKIGSDTSAPFTLAPPPPAIRVGDHRDPYKTPDQTPQRKVSKGKRPAARRSNSTETIDVLMPAPSFLQPPSAPGMRENRMTQGSTNTTFTKLMEGAGYDEKERGQVRGWERDPTRRNKI